MWGRPQHARVAIGPRRLRNPISTNFLQTGFASSRALGSMMIGRRLRCLAVDLVQLNRLNLSGSPSLVEPRFERTIQPQEGVPALPRDRLHPVCFLARGSLWSVINVHRTIRIDQQSLGQTTDRWGLLIGLEHRACLVIVECEGPEILGRNV